MRHVLGLCIAAALIPALAPRAVEAASGAPEIVDNWANMDRCYKESFVKYPDFTKEAELARQQFVRRCQVRYSINSSRPLILRQQQ